MNRLKKNKIKYAIFVFVVVVLFVYFSDLVTFMRYAFSTTMQVYLDAKSTAITYTITYELNGGTQAVGQPTTGNSETEVVLLEPTKENNEFLGWYDNAEFTGNPITLLINHSSDITLYAKWEEHDLYIDDGSFNGTSEDVINTGLYLYSAENVNKNFRIAFTIDSYNSDYDDPNNVSTVATYPTIVSSMDETGSPYPGLVFRVVANGGVSKYNLKINDSNVTSVNKFYDLQSGINVEIVRENGSIYTKINSRVYTKVLDYAENIDIINVPLTIGGNINAQGQVDRYFNGQLSNIVFEFYEGNIIDATNTTSNYTEVRESNLYELNGYVYFDGVDDYIDTGINLFSAENIHKDFDIEFTVETIGTNTDQSTLVNNKDESQNNVWPGFAYRTSGGQMSMTARWPGETNVTKTATLTPPKKIKISRRNEIIYYKIGDSEEQKLISVPAESLTNPIGSNLTFGASINSSGSPFRFFNGSVSDIKVELKESSGTSSAINPDQVSTNSMLPNIEPEEIIENTEIENENVENATEVTNEIENTITNEIQNVISNEVIISNTVENTIVENTIGQSENTDVDNNITNVP